MEVFGGGGGEVRGVGGCDVVEGMGFVGFEVGGESFEVGKVVFDGYFWGVLGCWMKVGWRWKKRRGDRGGEGEGGEDSGWMGVG